MTPLLLLLLLPPSPAAAPGEGGLGVSVAACSLLQPRLRGSKAHARGGYDAAGGGGGLGVYAEALRDLQGLKRGGRLSMRAEVGREARGAAYSPLALRHSPDLLRDALSPS